MAPRLGGGPQKRASEVRATSSRGGVGQGWSGSPACSGNRGRLVCPAPTCDDYHSPRTLAVQTCILSSELGCLGGQDRLFLSRHPGLARGNVQEGKGGGSSCTTEKFCQSPVSGLSGSDGRSLGHPVLRLCGPWRGPSGAPQHSVPGPWGGRRETSRL